MIDYKGWIKNPLNSFIYFDVVFLLESDTTQTPQVDDLIEKAGSKLSCKECKKTYSNKSKAQLISHIESQHLKLEVKCDLCEKQFKATSYLKQHQKKGACAPTTN